MKCSICNGHANYHRVEDGKDIYFCWNCAIDKYHMLYSWSSKCQHCGAKLNVECMYIMEDPKIQDVSRSFCDLDCAMKYLKYEVLD